MCKSTAKRPAPEWLAKANLYQINPRTFSADGTLSAITRELPFLAELGFKIIYICPMFEMDEALDNWSDRQKASGTGNPKNLYRMNNYFNMDSEFGCFDDLRELVSEAHKLGLKVLLDLVYYHIGPSAPILETHPEFAMHDEHGNIIYSAGVDTVWHFPRLNFESEGLKEYLWATMVYYVGEFDVDGFRCDVGDWVPADFWAEGRRRILAVKPDAIMLNEGFDNNHLTKAFDINYTQGWHDSVHDAVIKGAPVSEIRRWYEAAFVGAPSDALFMRDVDNHDTVTDWKKRTEVEAGHDGMELIQVLNYLIDGVPIVYCGNELADTADISMFHSRFYPGKYTATDRDGIKNTPESLKRQALMKKLNALRAECDAISKGSTVWNEADDSNGVISFTRSFGNESIIFVANLSSSPCTAELSLGDISDYKALLISDNAPKVTANVFDLPAKGYIVLKK